MPQHPGGLSLLLGTAGGALGALAALAMGLAKIRTLNFQTFSRVRFGFAPTPGSLASLAAAVAFGAAMGLSGKLLPAARAVRPTSLTRCVLPEKREEASRGSGRRARINNISVLGPGL